MVLFSLQRKRKKKVHFHGHTSISKSIEEIHRILDSLRGTFESNSKIDAFGNGDKEKKGTVSSKSNTEHSQSYGERLGTVPIVDGQHVNAQMSVDERGRTSPIADGQNDGKGTSHVTISSGGDAKGADHNSNLVSGKRVSTQMHVPMQETVMAGNAKSFADVLLGKTSAQNSSQTLPKHTAVPSENKSFAEALQGDVPVQKQLGSVVKVNPEILQKRIDLNKFSIIGRIILAKGDEPWNLFKLKEKLTHFWNLQSSWKLISLGKGFYQILLSSAEDKLKVWSRGSINLKPGLLRLQEYSITFDPLKEKTTHTQAWFRLYHLPWGLWDPAIISDIVWRIGTPLKLDKATMNGNFGHYARVLVDVDLAKQIKSSVLMECGDEMVEVKIVPEKLPVFCKACSTIGHVSAECWTLKSSKEKPKKSTEKSASKGNKGVDKDVVLDDLVEAKSMEPTQSQREVAKVVDDNTILANMAPAGFASVNKKLASLAVSGSRRFEEGMEGNSTEIGHNFYNPNEEASKKNWGDLEEDSDSPSEEPWIEVERKRSKHSSLSKHRPCTRSQSIRK